MKKLLLVLVGCGLWPVAPNAIADSISPEEMVCYEDWFASTTKPAGTPCASAGDSYCRWSGTCQRAQCTRLQYRNRDDAGYVIPEAITVDCMTCQNLVDAGCGDAGDQPDATADACHCGVDGGVADGSCGDAGGSTAVDDVGCSAWRGPRATSALALTAGMVLVAMLRRRR